jgi:hypothetical protein
MYLAFRSSSDCEALAAPTLTLPDDESGGEGNLDAPLSAVEVAQNLGEAFEDCCRLTVGFRGVELLEWLLDR